MSNYLSSFYNEVGLKALVSSQWDTKVLCVQRFVRFFAYGSSTLVLTLYLTALGHSTEKTGLFMTLTLLGDVVISLILTAVADKIGRRRILALGAILMACSGVVFALFSQYWILVLASIVGVISPSGNEIGPFRAIEESTISQLVSSADRSSVFAWYTLFGTAGAALGSMITGWVLHALRFNYNWEAVDSYRMVFWVYAVLGLVKLALCQLLTEQSELVAVKKTPKDRSAEQRLMAEDGSPEDEPSHAETSKASRLRSFLPDLSRHTVVLIGKLCLLFAMDSFGSGMSSNSWMVFFFKTKFGLDEGKLGSLFFFTNILSSASNLAAASLARHIGLIKTMVFTHLPSSLILALIPLPGNEMIAMTLLLVRSSINSMDQAPRQAFLAAAVLPEERTTVMGIVNVCKTLSQAGGPIVTGTLAGIGSLGVAFIIAGSLKCGYDFFMLGMFLGYRTIEERNEVPAEEALEMQERDVDSDEESQKARV